MAPRSVEMKRAHAVAAAWAPTRGRARKIAAAHLALKPHHVPRVPALHRIMILQRKKGSGLAGVTSRRARACCRASSARSANRNLPRSTNPRHHSVAAQSCMALGAKCRQAFCPDEAAGSAVRGSARARAKHIRSAGRGDRHQNGERKQGRQNAASSPSHVNPLDF
jgi:hypothetical protein